MENNLEKFASKEKQISREIISYIIKNPSISRNRITSLKGKIAKKYNFNSVIKNAKIIEYALADEKELIKRVFKRRTTRSLSGVSVIAIMTKPLKCPGSCIYCPGVNSQPGEKVAQSYTGKEPAAMRSIYCDYDAFRQVQSRIDDLEAIGHDVDKIECVVMGGCFLAADESYQREFIKGAIEGIINKNVFTLEQAKKEAEISKRRLIGLTIETRPDYCKEEHVDKMLNYGTTRVEIGIQTIYDEIYKIINRGHTVKDSLEAIRIAKDAGLKVNSHIMPNLPGSDLDLDSKMFKELFSNSNYRPDMLKIYPCLVIKGTKLYDLWFKGYYKPYNLNELIDLLVEAKVSIPSYIRIQRVMRDIPAYLIEGGCKKSNLRQLVKIRLDELNLKCNCIRCREYGIKRRRKPEINFNDVSLHREDYEASMGKEIFLSYENDQDNFLVGYLRLRKPSEFAHRPELNDNKTVIVREIRVVGELVVKAGSPRSENQLQHRGYGKKLMGIAEKIASEEFDAKKISVISGIGARDWFYQLGGYFRDGPYVSKLI